MQWQFSCINFMQSIEFANKLAYLAENESHHPDLTIEGKILYHKINSLSESDFILAAKITILLTN